LSEPAGRGEAKDGECQGVPEARHGVILLKQPYIWCPPIEIKPAGFVEVSKKRSPLLFGA
jgi:hypothetical protein